MCFMPLQPQYSSEATGLRLKQTVGNNKKQSVPHNYCMAAPVQQFSWTGQYSVKKKNKKEKEQPNGTNAYAGIRH